jgi:membrane-bound lytic murein transglycosylase B
MADSLIRHSEAARNQKKRVFAVPARAAGNWLVGYREALDDLARLAASRGIASQRWERLLADLREDAAVIERQHKQRVRRAAR